MATLLQIAKEYQVSKSTVRRWVEKCMPEVFDGKRIDLDESQMHTLAHFVEENELATIGGDSKADESQTVHEPVYEVVDERVMDRLRELEIENASLRAENAVLNRSVNMLENRLEAADKALEREQMQARGFWSRLGQKLLGKSTVES